MHLQFWRWKHWCTTAIAVSSTLILGDPAYSQSIPTSPSLIDFAQNSAAEKDLQQLPPAVRRTLEAELAQEAKAKRIGIPSGRSFPLPVCVAGKCGAVNRDGTFAVTPAYDRVDRFAEGRAVVEVRHGYSYLYGYVDDTGRVISIPQYGVAGRFSRGFAQIDFEGKSGLIDLEGRAVLWPVFGFVVPFTADLFWATEERKIAKGNSGREEFLFDTPLFTVNGVLAVTAIMPKGRWGLVDRSGSWVRRPEFLDIRVFDRGDSRFMWAKTNAGWGLLRSDLSWQVEPRFEQVGSITDNFAPVALKNLWGFVDATGKIVIEPRFDYAFGFSGPYAPVRVKMQFGMIDRTGAWAIEPTYDGIVPGGILIPQSWWNIKVGNKYGLLDDSLRVVIGPELDQSAAMCEDGRIIGFADKKWHLFSRSGAPENDDAGCDSMITIRRN